MNERELTTKALNKLEFHTGLVARVTEPAARGKGRNLDAMIQFNNSKAKLVAELKKWGADADVAALIEQITAVTGGRDKIVISDYIAEDVGARLREARVKYLDRAGNAYLDISPIYVLIQGKTPKEKVVLDKANRLFTEIGLKVVFALLSNPGLLNANYRGIADHANVSMGTIGWVLRELKDQGYTSEMCRVREWKNRSELIKKWAEEYPILRAKTQLGSFYCRDKNWWKKIDLEDYDAVLGGEIAAINYTDVTKPRNGVIYVGKHKHRSLIRDLKLADVTNNAKGKTANIEIRSRFWGHAEDLSSVHKSTHPLITYADLLDTWDSVSRGIAGQIADKYFHD